MSYDLVQTLQHLDDTELFKICFVKLVNRNRKKNYYFDDYESGNNKYNDKFKETLMFFQELIANVDEGRIYLDQYVKVVPFYIELATRINKVRKYSSSGFNTNFNKNIYEFPQERGFILVNKRVEFNNISKYLKMRLSLVLSYDTLNGFWISSKNKYIKNLIDKIKEKDDEILKMARKVFQPITAMTRNVNNRYYDIY